MYHLVLLTTEMVTKAMSHGPKLLSDARLPHHPVEGTHDEYADGWPLAFARKRLGKPRCSSSSGRRQYRYIHQAEERKPLLRYG